VSPDPTEQPPVRQRNTTGSAWTFASEPPVRVEVGEVHEHPVLLDGWTAVRDEPEQPAADEALQPKTTTKTRRATAADTEGGEPR
jgi:hypothetical protein